MSPDTSDTLSRLRAANPCRDDPERGSSTTSQATLERILNDPASTAARPGRRLRLRLPRGGLGVAVAVLCLGGGAAIAATNPFGWWSSSPSSARYAVDAAVHVQTPTAQEIACRSGATGFVCTTGRSGQRYDRIDSVQLPGRLSVISRAGLTRAIRHVQAEHRISRARADRLLAELAAVPDSFFSELRLGFHYATISTDDRRVPPPGVPEFLVCQDAGPATLSCENLNGDNHAPVGAGIYGAVPERDWRPAPRVNRIQAPLPPGIHFTLAESLLMVDLTRVLVTTGGANGGNVVPGHRPPTRRAQ